MKTLFFAILLYIAPSYAVVPGAPGTTKLAAVGQVWLNDQLVPFSYSLNGETTLGDMKCQLMAPLVKVTMAGCGVDSPDIALTIVLLNEFKVNEFLDKSRFDAADGDLTLKEYIEKQFAVSDTAYVGGLELKRNTCPADANAAFSTFAANMVGGILPDVVQGTCSKLEITE